MTNRYFTPAEVNQVIPELERIIKHLRATEGEIQEKEWRLKQVKVEARRRGDTITDITFLGEEAEIEFHRMVAQGHFERVRELGGDIKGGYLVDFLSLVDGNEVLICWKPGETSVQWYHGLYEGMLGRKPIPPELLEDSGPVH